MSRLFLLFISFIFLSAFSIEQWQKIDVEPAYQALHQACIKKRAPHSQAFCARFYQKRLYSPKEKRAFFASYYQLKLLTDEGKLTAYFLPLLEGSLSKSAEYPHPVWGVPKNFKKPYLTRKEIDEGALKGKETPLLWVKSKVDLFFLHIQGSGKVLLPDGSIMGLGFAAKNGQEYNSIGKKMVAEGLIEGADVSMQGIKKWLNANPSEINRILWHNPSYIFFRKQEADKAIGAQGVPLTTKGSVAVDPNHIAYGTPIVIETTLPDADKPSLHLAIAQDTGSAIKTEKRMDWFLGYGKEAGDLAGRMHQDAIYYTLSPRDNN